MVELCAIASGSNGNCYYIGNEYNAVLIDAGINCKQILYRMAEAGLNPQKVKAVFITHEHSDHLMGARVIAKKLRVPVYITPKTFNSAYRNLQPEHPRFFNPGDTIEAGDFLIHSFLKNHDTPEPCSFRVTCKNTHIGVFTDIGEPCQRVIEHFNLCHAVFLETNYDEDMLWKGPYPWVLKNRIASAKGHLSNRQAFELLHIHAGENLKTVLLSHLSAENNTPETAFGEFAPLNTKFDIYLTSRHRASDVFKIEE